MIRLHGLILSLFTVLIYCHQMQAESCEDPGWCAGIGDTFCKTQSFIKRNCKMMCGKCKESVCKRDTGKLEDGRKCQPRCIKGACKSNFHTCRCDDWCGKSCFNSNAKCGRLASPKNGEIFIRGRRYGQHVTYKCKSGYALIGPPSRSCRSDRKWSGFDPYCVSFSACGFTEKHTQDKVSVANGKDAKKGSWPWQVALIKSEGYLIKQVHKNSVVGGGSVISDEWVLSAAHVFTDLFGKNIETKSWSNSFHLVLGMESFVRDGLVIPEHIQIFTPETVTLHPKFDRNSLDYDVAMIRIGRRLKRGPNEKFIIDDSDPGGKVTFTRFIRPVCLPCMKGSVHKPAEPWKNFDEDKCNQKDESIFPAFAATGSNVVVTGFGVLNPLPAVTLMNGTDDMSRNLQEGHIKIVDPITCVRDIQGIQRQNPGARFTNRMFCASGGTEKKVDACKGDSGGPVVKRTKMTKNKRVRYWMQLGIVSWGVGCASQYHGYYTSIPSIMKWVWKTLVDSKKGTHCPDISPTLSGDVVMSSKPPYQVGTTANFTCNSRLGVKGHRIMTCLSDGKWSDKIPLCAETHCPEISSVAHGDTITSSPPPYKVGTTVNFTCDLGFRKSRESTLTCLSNGEWSDKKPYCIQSICNRNISKLERGRKCQGGCEKGTCQNKFHTCRCDDWCGESCFDINAKCERLTAPTNGEIFSSGRRYGQRVTYKCKPGYTLIGPPSRSCRSDRKWSWHDPYCVPFSACGFTMKYTQNTARVVSGNDAKKGAWPWHVALIRNYENSVEQVYRNNVAGGGSVISEEWVLTSAHTFNDLFEDAVDSKIWSHYFHLVFGMTSFTPTGIPIQEHIEIFEPETVIWHPKFNRRSLDYDVALIRIGKRLKRGSNEKFIIDDSDPGGKVTFTQFIRPVCLPCMKGSVLKPAEPWKNFNKDECDQKDKPILPSFAVPGTKVVVTGFGRINSQPIGVLSYGRDGLPRNLQEGQIEILDRVTCARDIKRIKLQIREATYSERMFCASGGNEEDKVDACQGDNGGPVVKRMRYGSNEHVTYWMQLGIVSWGAGCASQYHGYYTSVPSIMNWVWKILDDSRIGIWEEWNQWSTCNVSCGAGERSRTRACQKSLTCGGDSNETIPCIEKPCHGAWKDWSLWSECSVICAGGLKTRTRLCQGPQPCIGEVEEALDCNPQKCEWGEWSTWSECSASCGDSETTRSRTCQRSGKCSGLAEESFNCRTTPCPGVWTAWARWSECSRTCGSGDRKRTRSCKGFGLCVGRSSEEELCNTELCPGVWSLWTNWSSCSATCGGGKMRRERRCQGAGICIGHAFEEKQCETEQCQAIVTCRSNPCDPNAYCRDILFFSQPSYICSCNPGYTGNGTICKPMTSCSKSCGGGKKLTRKQCGFLGMCSRVYEECNTHICPKELTEAKFVSEQFRKAVLAVSSGNSKNTDEKGCVPNNYRDYRGRIRMMGKSCPRRVKRESDTQSQFQDKTKRDALFLIDESGSIGEEGFKTFLKATKAIVNSFCEDVDIGKNRTSVSVVSFDSTQHDHIHFNSHHNKKDLTDAIENIRFSKKTDSSTCIVQTLRFVKDKMFTSDRGARTVDESTEKVIFLFSDGCENCLTSDVSGELNKIKMDLREKGISIITIFVGNPTSDCINQMQVLVDTNRCQQTFIFNTLQELTVALSSFDGRCISEWTYDINC